MQVKDIMTSRPHYLGENATIREVAEAMRDNKTGFEPLTNEEKVVGVVTDRDLVIRAIADQADPESPAKAIATGKVLYTFQENSVEDALANMVQQQVQRLLVLDDEQSKQLVGIITVGDIAENCRDQNLSDQLASAVSFYR